MTDNNFQLGHWNKASLLAFSPNNDTQQVLCKALRFALSVVLLPSISAQGLPPKSSLGGPQMTTEQRFRECELPTSTAEISPSITPLDWLLNPIKGSSLSDRILARLVQAEAHEPDPWLRDDYRQAFITVTVASRGNTMPFVVASYQMYGLHPDKVYSAILARRKALLGPAGAELSTQPSLQSAPVKKSPKSVTDERKSA